MSDFRAFCTPATAEPAEIGLSAAESHHLIAVNRARPGDVVVAFDGHGREWFCELIAAPKDAAVLKVRSSRRVPRCSYEISLGQALPKGPGMDAIVRKATEIGVARIIPLESERTQVHFEAERSERKVEKWRAAALEAAKQCGNAFLPEVQPVQNATRFMSAAGSHDLKLIASLQPGAKSLKTVLAAFQEANSRTPAKVLWVVGPEGDFAPAEMSVALSSGFEPITLGPLVLRCETAAVYALSILSYELQNAPADLRAV